MANVKEYNDIMGKMQKGEFAPVYLLHGEEPFYIDKISKYIEEHAIEEHERDFNLNIFYGRDLNSDALSESIKRYPMMAQRQIVIVREAQDYSGQWTDLEAYFENPVSSTVFVIDFKYKKVDERTKWVKAIKQSGVVFHSSKHYDSEIPGVVSAFTKSIKYRISSPAAQLMADYLGNDLEKIEGEIKKLTISVPLSREINLDDVKQNIGISKEFSTFEFVDALAERQVDKSYTIAHYIGKNEKNSPFVLVIGTLFTHFSKVLIYHTLKDKSTASMVKNIPGVNNAWFAGKVKNSAPHYSPRKAALIIEKLREVDARFKGVNSVTISESELLKELTYFILN